MMSFKGKHFPKDVILFAVYFYLRYPPTRISKKSWKSEVLMSMMRC